MYIYSYSLLFFIEARATAHLAFQTISQRIGLENGVAL